jgi:hypothetical protein
LGVGDLAAQVFYNLERCFNLSQCFCEIAGVTLKISDMINNGGFLFLLASGADKRKCLTYIVKGFLFFA